MVTVPKTAKRCGTCQYWSGAREILKSGQVVHDRQGLCTAAMSGSKGKEVSGNHWCSHWKRWIAIT